MSGSEHGVENGGPRLGGPFFVAARNHFHAVGQKGYFCPVTVTE